MAVDNEFEVVDVATETRKAIMLGDEERDLFELIAEMANDVKEIKAEIVGGKK